MRVSMKQRKQGQEVKQEGKERKIKKRVNLCLMTKRKMMNTERSMDS